MNKYMIAHSIPNYLFITGSWFYELLINYKKFKPIVITNYTQNMDLFPFEHVYSLNVRNFNYESLFVKLYNYIINKKLIKRKRLEYFSELLNKKKVFLLHSHFGNEGFDNIGLKQKLEIPMITSFYGYDVSMLVKQPYWIYRYRKLFSIGNLFLAEGNYMKKSLIELSCPEEKIIVQRLGINLEKFKFKPRKIGKDEKVKILIAGSFREKKGIVYAIDALRLVNRKHKNIELTIIGDSSGALPDEREKNKIISMIYKYNLEKFVNLLGYQPYSVFIEELYRNHIFLCPSVHALNGDSEGGAPVSLIEASGSGMPVISTYHCDIPEVVNDEESGYLVPERDIAALAEKLDFLISNPEIWEKLGGKGRKHIEDNYNVLTQTQKLEKIYEFFK